MSQRVLIAEAETLLADLLGAHVRRMMPDGQVRIVRTVAELEEIAPEEFDLAILDLLLADGDVLEWLNDHARAQPRSPVIALTACDKDFILYGVLKSGVAGIVHKADGLEFLEIAIKTVLIGGSVLSPKAQEIRTKFASDPTFFAKLISEREMDVLRTVGAGLSTSEAAELLGIQETTVIDHRKNLRQKLGFHSHSQLMVYAIEKGFAPVVRKQKK